METSQALRLAGRYVGLALAATVVGGVILAAGVVLNGLAAPFMYQYGASPRRILVTTGPGMLLVLVGVIVLWVGNATAAFIAIGEVVRTETAEELDTATLKSEILSVIDERLAEMHTEVSETRRLVNRLSRADAADEFDFDEG